MQTTELQRKALLIAGQANDWEVSTPSERNDDCFVFAFIKGDHYLDVVFEQDGTLKEAWTATPPWNHGPIPDVSLSRLVTFLRRR